LKVIRQGIVLWAQFTQDALGVLIDVLEPDWGMPAAVEAVERDLADTAHAVVTEALGTARPGAW
jgi:hypothetical protein